MEILINIAYLISGFILNSLIRNLIIYLLRIKEKIRYAERIIEKEEKRRKFKEKFDFDNGNNINNK